MGTGTVIGLITAGSVHLECVVSLIKVVQSRGIDCILPVKTGPYLDDGRNHVVDDFIRYGKGERLLMLDSDVEFEPEHVARLVEDDLPIVSGIYHNVFKGELRPVVFYRDQVDPRVWDPVHEWPSDDAVVPADGVGGGFLMIRRDVIEAFTAAYQPPCQFFHEPITDGVHYGEDIGFCMRATELGIPVMVDRRVQVNHYKSLRLPQ